METAATLALALCQQMSDTKAPNTGNYLEGMQGPYGMVGQIQNASLIQAWFPYCQWTNYGAMPSWDQTTTPGNTTGMPHPYATAASMLCIEFLISSGQMTLAEITKQITDTPYLTLNDLYNGQDLQTDAVNAMLALGMPTNNDPLSVWGVDWGSSGNSPQGISS